MIACDRADDYVLRAIAHECRHLFQDAKYGSDWRFDNRDAAEYDASQFEARVFEDVDVH